MRVWVDLTNSPHVLVLRPVIRVLERAGAPGELTDSREAWQAFLVATMEHA